MVARRNTLKAETLKVAVKARPLAKWVCVCSMTQQLKQPSLSFSIVFTRRMGGGVNPSDCVCGESAREIEQSSAVTVIGTITAASNC